MTPAPPTPPWTLEPAATLTALGSQERQGLDEREAGARLARLGANELARAPAPPCWHRLLEQFQDRLVMLLLAAALISALLWALERDTSLPFEAMAILAVVLLNATMGFVKGARAEQAVAALGRMTAAQATVLREGSWRTVPAAGLVPGDIIAVEEGATVPADARLLHAAALESAEATLTGESLPVAKQLPALPAETPLAERACMLFSGTAVTRGHGQAVVTATGMATEMGRIAGLLATAQSETTPLQRELDRVGRLLGRIVIAIAVVMVSTILLLDDVHGWGAVFDVLLLGVALAVAAVPEGLPAVVTAVLAAGVQRMARRRAILRHLSAVETLGSADVIASDKTGTLTRNEMTVCAVVTAGGEARVTGMGYAPEGTCEGPDGAALPPGQLAELRTALGAAIAANNAALRLEEGQWSVIGDPTEGALLTAARKAGLEEGSLRARVAELPFSSERKLMSVLLADGLLCAKGAPDVLLGLCTHERVGDQDVPLEAARRGAILSANAAMADQALRTLAVAERRQPRGTPPEEAGLVFLGLVAMRDPPRAEARQAVARARAAGIRPLMITGDHPATAAAIARELGIADDGRVLTGAALEAMDGAALADAVRQVSVYARVNPEHKLRIVEALQAQGAIVAMTGDGVNDAPALRRADIGVAMGIAGTDVSRQAADMILADDHFATIVTAVEEGRAIFSNIRKFLRYLLSSNIGEVLTMFLGVVLAGAIGLSAPEGSAVALPLLATQILWINLVTDGAPALALGLDPASRGIMDRPPRPRGEGVITGRMWRGILLVGPVMAAGTLAVLDACLPGGFIEGTGSLAHGQTMAFTTLTLFQLFNVLNARSDERSAFDGLFRNGWLWGAIGLSLLMHAAVLYLPPLRQAFSTVPLGWGDWALCAGVASSVLWLREASKLLRW